MESASLRFMSFLPGVLGRSCRRPCADRVWWKIELHHGALVVQVGGRTEGADARGANADDVFRAFAQVDPRQDATPPPDRLRSARAPGPRPSAASGRPRRPAARGASRRAEPRCHPRRATTARGEPSGAIATRALTWSTWPRNSMTNLRASAAGRSPAACLPGRSVRHSSPARGRTESSPRSGRA